MARIVIAGVLLASLAAAAAAAGLLAHGKAQIETCKALFVFGDSYVDTGDVDPTLNTVPWVVPYGNTWPGSPAGRFSDGRVLTDYIASYLNVEKPTPFRVWNMSLATKGREIKNHKERAKARADANFTGINFAHGGSGVFNTFNDSTIPRITTQVQYLSNAISLGKVNVSDLSESCALFSVNGNDYSSYLQENGFLGVLTISNLIPLVVEQMGLDIGNLSTMGFTNFLITNMAPSGIYFELLLPSCITGLFTNYSILHNSYLQNKISSLQEQFPNSSFNILDLHTAFAEVEKEGDLSLEPCCRGPTLNSCGKVDDSGNPTYTLCSDVNATLFWDGVHPTHNGWFTLVKKILPDFQKRYNLQ